MKLLSGANTVLAIFRFPIGYRQSFSFSTFLAPSITKTAPFSPRCYPVKIFPGFAEIISPVMPKKIQFSGYPWLMFLKKINTESAIVPVCRKKMEKNKAEET